MLSEQELERYARQLVLRQWSPETQERLKLASAIIVGAGALGSPVALYLTAAGIGQIGIVDDDNVELSNLHRQLLHFTPDLGLAKADNAVVKLRALNPETHVEPYPVRFDAANGSAIVAGADVVVDCSDCFESRCAVNAACCAEGVDLVEAGVLGLSGLVMTIRPGVSACYSCAFPKRPTDPDDGAREQGVLGPVAGIIGSIQALEALKLLGGVGEPLLDRILMLEASDMTQTLVATQRRPDCSACAGVPAAAQSS